MILVKEQTHRGEAAPLSATDNFALVYVVWTSLSCSVRATGCRGQDRAEPGKSTSGRGATSNTQEDSDRNRRIRKGDQVSGGPQRRISPDLAKSDGSKRIGYRAAPAHPQGTGHAGADRGNSSPTDARPRCRRHESRRRPKGGRRWRFAG